MVDSCLYVSIAAFLKEYWRGLPAPVPVTAWVQVFRRVRVCLLPMVGSGVLSQSSHVQVQIPAQVMSIHEPWPNRPAAQRLQLLIKHQYSTLYFAKPLYLIDKLKLS
jgi:hypothetical protein